MRVSRVVRGLAVLAVALAAYPAAARFASLGEVVPVERLVSNVGRWIKEHPEDAGGYYTLGRIHSMAFAQGEAGVRVIPSGGGAPRGLPGFAPYLSVRVHPRRKGQDPPGTLTHLAASIRSYRRATELAPKEALYWLGYGWMLELGASRASEVDAPFSRTPARLSSQAWEQEALNAYRDAYTLRREKELQGHGYGLGGDASIGLEAAEGIVRLLSKRELKPAERTELAQAQQTVQVLRKKPRAITPIVFPLSGSPALSELLAPGKTVRFDVAGDGRSERWPWLSSRAVLLVWDPLRTGRIASGRQLFGSGTWCMFWRDGYAPLAALDDDADGWLAGRELDGLAGWQDRDGDGKSDPGEVRPLAELGVVRVSVRAGGAAEGVPANARGIEWADGSTSPTYDWTPTSVPDP